MKKPLSIYLHIPFCVQKCAYCDFLSAPAAREVQEQYLHMLMKEIRDKAEQYSEKYMIQTIFIGGGTPTCVEADLLCEVLAVIRKCFVITKNAEISMECNPGTASLENLYKYVKAGVNRLSIGLQSTQDHLLRKLGRIHTYEQFLETYKNARKAGFTNINIDLMSALPEQSLEDYTQTLKEVLELRPEHISAYSLIVEEDTPFWDMELDLPDEDTERVMYELTKVLLEERGYHRYEISNYALKDRECRHNIVYWDREEYLGLGLGASSFIRYQVPDPLSETHLLTEEKRMKNNSNLETYLKGDFSYEEESIISFREAIEEFFFLGLRKMKGVNLIKFAKLFGEDTIEEYYDVIEQNINDGLLEQYGPTLRLTAKGIDVSNLVFERFIE